jgi:hypothetical protein
MTYGDHLSMMPRTREQFNLYCVNLGYTAKDPHIGELWDRHSDLTRNYPVYVSTKHFDPVDIMDNGKLQPDGISKSSRDHMPIIGDKRKWKNVMIPSATLAIVQADSRCFKGGTSSKTPSSRFSRTTSSSRSSDGMRPNIPENDTPSQEAIERLVVQEDKEPKERKENPSRRTYKNSSKPKPYAIVADPYNVVTGLLAINEHSRMCCTTELLHTSRDDVRYHGLCGEIVVRCSKGKACTHWHQGKYIFHSQTPVSIASIAESHELDDSLRLKWIKFMPKKEYKANILHAVGESVTTAMPAETERFLTVLGAKTRSATVRREYRKHIVIPILDRMQVEEEVRIYDKYAHQEGNAFTYDACHSSVRMAVLYKGS